MLSPELQPKYKPEPGDEKLWVLLCRRATIETVLRRYVSRLNNIRIVNNVHIDGVLADQEGDHLVVRGVRVRRDCTDTVGEEIRTDVVVDATGRSSRFPKWFEQLGMPIEEENDDVDTQKSKTPFS